ncbi:MAG: porin family protein [Alistipes sp.]|jgi:hypothetical protein|nr:porin family protein [Alistipes sp.]
MKNSGQFLLAVAFSAIAFSATAQKSSVSVGWGTSIPTGGGNFRNETSWVSPSVDWEYRLLPLVSLGVSAGLGLALEKAVTHDTVGGDTIDGLSDRRLVTVPLMARLRLWPLGEREGLFRPFVSVGGGAQYARFDITGDAIVSTGSGGVGAVLSAGAGVRCYPVKRNLFIELSGDWRRAANKFEIMDSRLQQSVEIRLGVGFTL